MIRRKKSTKKKSRKGSTLASFQRAVNGNKSLRAAKAALKKAETRKKRAYKKAVTAARKKVRRKR